MNYGVHGAADRAHWACAIPTRTRKGPTRRRCSAGSISRGLPPATAAELARAKLSIFRPQSYSAADDGGSFSGRANLAYAFTDDLFGVRELCATATSPAASTCRVCRWMR